MNQTITITQSDFQQLVERLNKLERVIFAKKYFLNLKIYQEEKKTGKLKKLNKPEELFS